jgi:hypothetical protein
MSLADHAISQGRVQAQSGPAAPAAAFNLNRWTRFLLREGERGREGEGEGGAGHLRLRERHLPARQGQAGPDSERSCCLVDSESVWCLLYSECEYPASRSSSNASPSLSISLFGAVTVLDKYGHFQLENRG